MTTEQRHTGARISPILLGVLAAVGSYICVVILVAQLGRLESWHAMVILVLSIGIGMLVARRSRVKRQRS
jgi:hypothetical protein